MRSIVPFSPLPENSEEVKQRSLLTFDTSSGRVGCRVAPSFEEVGWRGMANSLPQRRICVNGSERMPLAQSSFTIQS